MKKIAEMDSLIRPPVKRKLDELVRATLIVFEIATKRYNLDNPVEVEAVELIGSYLQQIGLVHMMSPQPSMEEFKDLMAWQKEK